jgi:hypothetical protein
VTADYESKQQTCRHLRQLSLDPLLHQLRLRQSLENVRYLLPRRPAIQSISPPISRIYLTRTHIAARRLHWSLVSIRLNRSLSRRPKLASLVSANILPKECCKIDRHSGDFVWGIGVAGPLVERRRRLERERMKEGLRVRLERKANAIKERRKESGGVGILIWRISKRLKLTSASEKHDYLVKEECPRQGKVVGLRRFWEGLGSTNAAATRV